MRDRGRSNNFNIINVCQHHAYPHGGGHLLQNRLQSQASKEAAKGAALVNPLLGEDVSPLLPTKVSPQLGCGLWVALVI
jgi:hypothetical protein